MYPVMYYGHNLQFESAAAMFAGRYAQARDAAKQTVELIDPIGDASPCWSPTRCRTPGWRCGSAVGMRR